MIAADFGVLSGIAPFYKNSLVLQKSARPPTPHSTCHGHHPVAATFANVMPVIMRSWGLRHAGEEAIHPGFPSLSGFHQRYDRESYIHILSGNTARKIIGNSQGMLYDTVRKITKDTYDG
jgi:hypothetical protein